MLPVVICEADSAVRSRWLDLLDDICRQDYPSLKLETLPGSERELKRMLEVEAGIMLVILAVTSAVKGGVESCIQLSLNVMARNRDNYVVLCMHDNDQLSMVLSHCMRPAGILLVPFQEELMRASLKRILSDYISLHQQDNDADYMIVTSGKTVRRIAYQDILYLEAQDKMLNICTSRHVITVRMSLNTVERTLPDGFIRCHRAYIVNKMYIEQIDLPNMLLQLKSQERLPISRSCKEALVASLKTGCRE